MSDRIVEDGYRITAKYYDHVVPYRDRPDVPFFVDEAVESGGPVLEVGCGTGRVLIPTARAGVEIVGIDLSPDMLALCRDRLDREPTGVSSRADVIEADMREFDLGRTFRLVTSPFRSFQHMLTVDDQLAALQSVYRHLEPGGRFILDIFNPDIRILASAEPGIEFGEEPEFTMPDGRRVVRSHRLLEHDIHNQTLRGELIYRITLPDGRTQTHIHEFALRHLFRFEAEHLLSRSGFQLKAVYAGYDKSPYGSTYPGELICVATKPPS